MQRAIVCTTKPTDAERPLTLLQKIRKRKTFFFFFLWFRCSSHHSARLSIKVKHYLISSASLLSSLFLSLDRIETNNVVLPWVSMGEGCHGSGWLGNCASSTISVNADTFKVAVMAQGRSGIHSSRPECIHSTVKHSAFAPTAADLQPKSSTSDGSLQNQRAQQASANTRKKKKKEKKRNLAPCW